MILQENESALVKYRPEFMKQIQAFDRSGIEGLADTIEFDIARDGNSVLVLKRDGQSYRLNSAFRPVQEADRWAAQFNFDHLENIILIFGLGNGIFVKSLLKQFGKDDKVIIYEPSAQIFYEVFNQIDLSDIIADSRVYIAVDGINSAEFYFTLEKLLDWRNIGAFSFCEHPGYEELFPITYEKVKKQVAECKELVHVTKHTDVYLAHKTVTNYFGNMQFIKDSNMITDFIGKIPEDFPAIIVSAGPSLDKNIEELKRAAGKAFILAVDTAVNVLLNHEIPFDAMITVDAKKNPGHLSREVCKKIPLLCGLMSCFEITYYHYGKKIWIIGSRFMDDVYESMGKPFLPINIGGSVSTAAFAACEKLGFKRIILVGQDLAYGSKGTHAGGFVRKIVNEEVGQQVIDGWSGDKVRSRYDWIIYRNWFESAIEQLPEVQVIDATEGGALIHGSELMALSEVIDRYCVREFPIRELFEQEPPTFNEEEYAIVRDKMKHLEKELQSVRRNAGDAVILCDEVINLIKQCGNTVSVTKQAKKLTALNKAIASQGVYQFLDYYVTDTAVEDLKEINQMTGNKEQDLINTYLSAKAMYESLIQAVKELKDIVHACLEAV